MGFGEAVASCFSKYANFSGRAPRSEYWWWFLFVILISICIWVAAGILFAATKGIAIAGLMVGLLYLGLLLPNISVSVRRLHDLNRSGWWLGLSFFLSFLVLGMAIPIGIRALENHTNGLPPAYGVPPAAFIVSRVLELIHTLYGLLLFIWFCMGGTRGANRFGDDPLRAF